MVDLPTVRDGGPPVMSTPRSSVTEQDFVNLGRAFSGAADAVSGALFEAGKPMAEASGVRMVTRDANGNVVVQSPETIRVGPLADVERKSAMMTYEAQLRSSASTYLQDLSQRTMLPAAQGGGDGNPAWFREQADAWVRQQASAQRGGYQDYAAQQGTLLVDQFYRGLTAKRADIDAERQKQALTARITALDDEASALARANYTGDEFRRSFEEYATTWQHMAEDPRFGVSKELAALKIAQAASRYKAEAIVGDVRKAYDPGTGGGYEAAMKRAEEIRTDAGLTLSDHERTVLYHEAIGEVRQLEAGRRAQAGALAQEGNKLADDIAKGIPVSEASIEDFTRRASEVGAVDQIRKIVRSRFERDIAGQARGMSTRDLVSAVQSGNAAIPAGAGRMQTDAVRGIFLQQVKDKGLVGTVPIDGPKYGIRTGSAEEWANFFTALSFHESGHKNGTVGDKGQFVGGSRGLLQLSFHDGIAYNNGVAYTADQLADPAFNAAAGVTIAKTLIDKSGSIRGGLGQYWGPISKEDWTPGAGRDAAISSTLSSPPASIIRQQASGRAAADEALRQGEIAAGRASPMSDPFIAATMTKVARERVGLEIPNMLKAMDAFEVPNKEDADALGQLAAIVGTPEQKQRAAEIGVRAQFGDAARTMTTGQLDALVAAKAEEYANAGSQAQKDAVRWAQKLPQEIRSRFERDPWSAATWMGIPLQSIKAPLDFSNVPALAEGLRAREADVALVKANRGIPSFSAFTENEAPQAKEILKNGTPERQAALIGAIGSIRDEGTRKATIEALYKGGDVNAQVQAAAIYRDNPEIARSILTGLQIIRSDKGFESKQKDVDREILSVLPPADISQDASGGSTPATWMTIRDAVTARAADLNFQAGRAGAEITTDTIRQAVQDVTGGIVKWHGKATIMPRPGMTDREFSAVMKGLGSDDVQGAIGIDGKPLSPSDLTGWTSPYKLQSGPDGKYLVYAEAGGVRQYVVRGGGASADRQSLFVLDLKGASDRVLRR